MLCIIMYTLSIKSEDLIDYFISCKEHMSFTQENMSLMQEM
mgnify:FL=1